VPIIPPPQDFALPDQARQVVFQNDRVFVGFRRDYILINITTGATTELFPTGRNQEPLVTRVDEYEVLLNKDSM
jgi:hypothetical protein